VLRTSELTACTKVSENARRKVSEVSWSKSATARQPPGSSAVNNSLASWPPCLIGGPEGCAKAAVDHAKVGRVQPGVFPRAHAHIRPFGSSRACCNRRRRRWCPSNRWAPNRMNRQKRIPYWSCHQVRESKIPNCAGSRPERWRKGGRALEPKRGGNFHSQDAPISAISRSPWAHKNFQVGRSGSQTVSHAFLT
jgi:hypothetical protein